MGMDGKSKMNLMVFTINNLFEDYKILSDLVSFQTTITQTSTKFCSCKIVLKHF